MKTDNIKFHVGINVSDIGRSKEFYADLLNSTPVKVHDDYAKFETDQIVLSLIKRPGSVQSDFGHFGLRVDDNEQLQAQFHRLKSTGHNLVEEENVDCCYAVQNKFWVKDPDGYDWEVYTFIEDGDQAITQEVDTVSAETECCDSQCC